MRSPLRVAFVHHGARDCFPFRWNWALGGTMRFVRSVALLVAISPACCAAAWGQATSPASSRKREQFRNAEITYDWVTNAHGQKIRTFVTRPRSARSKVPAIFFVGWLSCDSVEYPDGETDGFGAIFWRLIEQSGVATVRMDKPGVGEQAEGGGGERLGVGGEREARAGVDRPAGLEVRLAESLAQHHLAIVNHRDGDTGDGEPRPLRLDEVTDSANVGHRTAGVRRATDHAPTLGRPEPRVLVP